MFFDPPARMVVRSENFLRGGARDHAPCCVKGRKNYPTAIFKAFSKNARIGDRSGYRAFRSRVMSVTVNIVYFCWELVPLPPGTPLHTPVWSGVRGPRSHASFFTAKYSIFTVHLRSTSLRLNFRDRMGPTPRLFTVRKSKMPESGIDPATVRKSTAYSVTLLESLVATPLCKALTLVSYYNKLWFENASPALEKTLALSSTSFSAN